MTDDLVKRLRNPVAAMRPTITDGRLAADRIEALTAERDKWMEAHRQACANWHAQCQHEMDKTGAAEAERDALIRDRDRWAAEAQVNTSPIMAGLMADNARLRAELTKAADSLDWADAHLEDAGVVSANVRYGARDARAALTGEETK
jgi:hypothetical protein